MKAILLTIMACLVASCVSSTREREAHCLGVLMVDVWQADDEFKSAERAWRTAQQTRVELSSRDQDFSVRTLLVNQVPPPSITPASAPAREEKSSNRMPEIDEERALYRQVTAAGEVRHGCLDAPQVVVQRGAADLDLRAGEAKVGEALRLGARGYVRKPFTAEQIKEKLAGVL